MIDDQAQATGEPKPAPAPALEPAPDGGLEPPAVEPMPADAHHFPAVESTHAAKDDFPAVDVVFDDIPIIDQAMIDHERVEFETGMRAIPPVTLALIFACGAVYLRQVWIGGLANANRVVATGAMSRDEVLGGQWWRLISSGFMHANAEHLLGNLFMLFILGMGCEHAFGRGQFLFLYVAACVAGSLLAMASGSPTVGASGAIFGLAGALIVMIRLHRSQLELRDHRVAIVLAVWAIYTLGLGFFDPIVSNYAHLGGLLGGSILGFFLSPAVLIDRAELDARPVTRLETVGAVIVLIGTATFFLPRLV
jgi:rhomboid protease GluP